MMLSLIIQEAVEKSTFTEITQLVEKIIWPIALIIILFMYKKDVGAIFSRFKSVKVDPTSGISLTFQDKINETANKLPQGLKSISKAGIQVNRNTPNDQLKTIRYDLETQLKAMAKTKDIDATGMSMSELSRILIDKGVITSQKSKSFLVLYELTNSNDPKISQSQVDQVKSMVKDIGF